MKNAVLSRKTQNGNDFRFDMERVRLAVSEALTSVDGARQKCLMAGQILNEAKKALSHGELEEFIAQEFPEVTDRTTRNWMRAAGNVAKALPPAPGDGADIDVEAEVISVSEILTRPDDELPEEARAWKQEWFDFTRDKTIKECIEGVVVDGEDGVRIDRAINGKTKGGAGGDRKDFPLFVAVKFNDIGAHFKHWEGMTDLQKNEIVQVMVASITGDSVKMRGRSRETFIFKAWPEDVCRAALEALKERVRK